MECSRIDTILNDHRQGELGAADKAACEAHLLVCSHCADAVFSYELLASETVAPPPAGLAQQVLAEVLGRRRPTTGRRPRRSLVPAFGLAAAVLVTVAAGLLTREPGEDRVPVTSADAGASTVVGQPESSPAAMAAPLARYVAGRDYRRLAVPAPTSVDAGVIEVCEFFMFNCIHCFNFEPMLTAWSEMLPDGVELVRVPALFNDLAELHARAFYAAETLGVLERLRQPLFDEIHRHGNALATRDDLRDFFALHGVDADSFDTAFDSFAVAGKLRRAEELNRLYGVNATPSMGVNGRFLTQSPPGGTNSDMLAVVDALVESEQAGNRNCAAELPSAC